MPLKEMWIQNSTESQKNLDYSTGHVIQPPVPTRANFKGTLESQGCLGHRPVKCCKSPGLERPHPAWALVPARGPLTKTSVSLFFPCAGGNSPAVACDCYHWSCHHTSLRSLSLSSPQPTINLLLNFRKHSSFHRKEWRHCSSQDNNCTVNLKCFVFFV